ncbi:MAG TPA: response regulator, partial [bacterium]|nr:response regulator [bacterium]
MSLDSPFRVAPPKKPKVLIVDDNPTNVELLLAQLRAYPYQLSTASDGEAALRKVEEDPPDLILLDLMMPKLSGYEVCQRIKSDKKTQFIPVIVITALKELEDKLKA